MPGAGPVLATFKSAGTDGGLPEMTFHLDRQALIQSIQAGITAGLIQPNSVLDLRVQLSPATAGATHEIGIARTRINGE